MDNINPKAEPKISKDEILLAIDEHDTKHWIYEYNLWKRPLIIIKIWKILIFASFIFALFIFLYTTDQGFIESIMNFGKAFGISGGIITLALLITYPIYVLANGEKYIVIFEMDKIGITSVIMDKSFTKNEGLEFIQSIYKKDLSKNSINKSNLINKTKKSIYTRFKKMTKIISDKDHNLIKLYSSDLMNNIIYVDNKNYDSILKEIVSRTLKSVVIKQK